MRYDWPMEEYTDLKFNPESEKFLRAFLVSYCQRTSVANGANSTRASSAVVLYEKLRVAVEYQEEHLIFKNAIARILRRKYFLQPNIEPNSLLNDLTRELVWANYVNPESLDQAKWRKIEKILERYLVILQNLSNSLYSKMDLQNKVIEWMACEIEDYIKPKEDNLLFVDFTTNILKASLEINKNKISEVDNLILIKSTVFTLIFKPDLPLIEHFILKQIYPEWNNYSLDELKKFGRSFEPYYNRIDHYLKHPYKANYLRFVKRNIPPFVVLRDALSSDTLLPENVKDGPAGFEDVCRDSYRKMVDEAKAKVYRGTFRALIFIFMTKMLLAFLVEVPYENYFLGGVHYTSLAINVITPPVLMLIAGFSIKSPSAKNAKILLDSVYNILRHARVDKKKHFLARKQKASNSLRLFNYIYLILNLAIMYGVIYLLLRIGFNTVSIVLFFFFVSIVSFFSFRIRNIATELTMERANDDTITSTMEFLFLPFIKIGKFISGRFANFNPFIIALDFFIEAPLKTIVKFLSIWRGFVNTKKEDLEY